MIAVGWGASPGAPSVPVQDDPAGSGALGALGALGFWGLWLPLQASAVPWCPRLCFPARPGPALGVLPGVCLLNMHLGMSNSVDTTESLESCFCHQLNLPLSFLVCKPALARLSTLEALSLSLLTPRGARGWLCVLWSPPVLAGHYPPVLRAWSPVPCPLCQASGRAGPGQPWGQGAVPSLLLCCSDLFPGAGAEGERVCDTGECHSSEQ